jgi:hypothetical protein
VCIHSFLPETALVVRLIHRQPADAPLLKRLRLPGLLRKVGKTYTYHFTSLAQRVVTAVLHLKNNVMVPELAAASAG